MTLRLFSPCLVFILYVFSMPLTGATEKPTRLIVVELLQKLADERYSVRQLAVKKLQEMGQPAEDILRKMEKHADPEVNARVEGVLEYFADMRKELKWIDPKILNNGQYRSTMGGRAVKVTFRNMTKNPVRIFWIESNGNRKMWRGLLKPGESDVCARTYTGHVWLVTDAAKNPLGFYRINKNGWTIAARDRKEKK